MMIIFSARKRSEDQLSLSSQSDRAPRQTATTKQVALGRFCKLSEMWTFARRGCVLASDWAVRIEPPQPAPYEIPTIPRAAQRSVRHQKISTNDAPVGRSVRFPDRRQTAFRRVLRDRSDPCHARGFSHRMATTLAPGSDPVRFRVYVEANASAWPGM